MKKGKDLVAVVVGLGSIGGGVAVSLGSRGRKMAVFDAVPDKYKELKGCPPQEETARDVAGKADIIMVAVFDYDQCRQVIFGKDGLEKGYRRDSFVWG